MGSSVAGKVGTGLAVVCALLAPAAGAAQELVAPEPGPRGIHGHMGFGVGYLSPLNPGVSTLAAVELGYGFLPGWAVVGQGQFRAFLGGWHLHDMAGVLEGGVTRDLTPSLAGRLTAGVADRISYAALGVRYTRFSEGPPSVPRLLTAYEFRVGVTRHGRALASAGFLFGAPF